MYTEIVCKGVFVGATNGTETLLSCDKIFNGYLDPNLGRWTGAPSSRVMPPTTFTTHKLIRNGTFFQIFTDLGEFGQLYSEQGQIKLFARDRRDKLNLDGYTLFLLSGPNGFFVSSLSFGIRKHLLFLHLYPLQQNGRVWRPEENIYIVVPDPCP